MSKRKSSEAEKTTKKPQKQKKSTHCRVCEKPFNDTETSNEHRDNIFKRDKDGNSIQTRYAKFNIILNHDSEESDSICKPCHTNLKALERADSILVNLKVSSELGLPSLVEEVISDILPQDVPMPVEVMETESVDPMDVKIVAEGPTPEVLLEESQGNDSHNNNREVPHQLREVPHRLLIVLHLILGFVFILPSFFFLLFFVCAFFK